jgi:predicted metal-dependent phosphotriesterase family hydrolase
LLTAEDIAPTIVHLTRPDASAITGANFVVDGGLTATFDFGSSFAGGDRAVPRSVTGAWDPATPGIVLPHEHLVIDYGEMVGRITPVDAALRARCLEVLHRMRAVGIGTIVDCTPPGYGRDLALLADLSRASGVAILASTGSFCEEWHPQPQRIADASVEELVEMFVAELTDGDVACGTIKVATSAGAMTPREEKLLTAASAGHRQTGAPIVSHTTGGLGLEQLDIFVDGDVEPAAVLVSHVCSADEPPDYAVEIARRGAYVGFDRLGHDAHDLEHWARLVQRMHREGVADRVLLGHDSVQQFTGPGAIAGHTFSDPTYLITTFLPALADFGVPPEVQHLMTQENPRRWLLAGGGQR